MFSNCTIRLVIVNEQLHFDGPSGFAILLFTCVRSHNQRLCVVQQFDLFREENRFFFTKIEHFGAVLE